MAAKAAEMRTGGVAVTRRDRETHTPLEVCVIPPGYSDAYPYSDPCDVRASYPTLEDVLKDPEFLRIVPSAPVVMAKAWGPGMSVVAVSA